MFRTRARFGHNQLKFKQILENSIDCSNLACRKDRDVEPRIDDACVHSWQLYNFAYILDLEQPETALTTLRIVPLSPLSMISAYSTMSVYNRLYCNLSSKEQKDVAPILGLVDVALALQCLCSSRLETSANSSFLLAALCSRHYAQGTLHLQLQFQASGYTPTTHYNQCPKRPIPQALQEPSGSRAS